MTKKLLLLTVLAVSMGLAGNASAVVLGNGGATLQGVFDGITVGPVAGSSSIDVNNDQVGFDEVWDIGGSGGSVTTLIIEIAGFAGTNSFGIYDPYNPGTTVQVFSGAQGAGSQATISILADGSIWVNAVDTGVDFSDPNAYGYYLDTTPTQPGVGLWYSQMALNSDGVDHMVAYRGKNIDTIQIPPFAAGLWTDNEYALAWEDLNGGGDRDYADMVLLVESTMPVPEPGTIMLFGLGLLGLGVTARRRLF